MPDHAYESLLRTAFEQVALEGANSRAAVARAMGISRSTAGAYIDALVRRGKIGEVDDSVRRVGRPARTLRVREDAGFIAAVDIHPGDVRVGLLDLGLRVRSMASFDVASDPEPIRSARRWIQGHASDGRRGDLLAVAACVPAPVNATSARVEPLSSLTQAWEGTRLVEELFSHFAVPYLLDNDANLLARREARTHRGDLPLLYVHLSHGVGAGLVDQQGVVWRGADGVAGDIAHMPAGAPDAPKCYCGTSGCVASATTLTRLLEDTGAADLEELARRVRSREPRTIEGLRRYADRVGTVIATTVNTVNPRTVAIGGEIAELGDVVLSGVRAAVYDRSLPVVSRNLIVRAAAVGPDLGIRAAAEAVLPSIP